ncbi:hypothetical protein [uncultured Dysosmobacter sp.]|uniref:hypothetical protein n=1 Tax=uncultured Dysosmobacter sp. TaxID=2591384 RepID=UPI0026084AB4|nr:hypothetical protein [uncultured Dysosmobacter sp.]
MKNWKTILEGILRYIARLIIWVVFIGFAADQGYLFIQPIIGSGKYPYYPASDSLIVLLSIETSALILLLALTMIRIYQRTPAKHDFWFTVGKGCLAVFITHIILWSFMHSYFGTFEHDYGFFDFLSGIRTILLYKFDSISFTLYCLWKLKAKN